MPLTSKHSNPTQLAKKLSRYTPVEARFWLRVDKQADSECWPWIGATNGRYGHLRVDGRQVKATHYSWLLKHGEPFPAGKLACHTCDNPLCVNPAHIWAGTSKDNVADMIGKGRASSFFLPRAEAA